MSELVFVAVPGGELRDGEAVLRVIVVPRLDGPPEARLSSSAMASWPELLAGTTFTVRTAASPSAPSTPHEFRRLDGGHVRPELWPKLFPPDMPLRAYSPPGTYSVPDVAPSTRHLKKIAAVYRSAAANPGDQFVVDKRLKASNLVPRAPARTVSPETPLRSVPDPDFHRVVTMLREHPAVLQALGLIVELRIVDAASLGGPALVSVQAQLAAGAIQELAAKSPWTSFAIERGRFLSAPAEGSDISHGMLDLAADHWEFSTFDVTGAVDRIGDATQSLRTRSLGAATLPALRSSGLSLLRSGRKDQLEKRIRAAEKNSRNASIAEAVLFADDLVLGYRVDVRTDVAGWASLMRRAAQYTTADLQPIVDHLEEGQIKANAATVEGPARADESRQAMPLRSDEVVARWDGWSLTCPRVLPDRRRGEGRQLPYLRWTFSPVGLPSLRFGTEYRMRVRIADAAGGGLEIEDPEFTEGQSREVFYGRHDPVPPPFLVAPVELTDPTAHPGKLGPGGALDILVIRSNPAAGEGVTVYAARYPANDARLVLPPPGPFKLAEEHGKLDGVAPETAAAWLRRAMTPEEHGLDGSYSWLPDPAAEGVALTVVPRPGVTSAGTTAHEAWVSPTGTWPDFPGKTVRLEEATSADEPPLDWTDAGRTAVVRLPPGRALTLALGSTVVNDEIDKFMMRDWLMAGKRHARVEREREGRPDHPVSRELLDDVMELVRTGRHPMVSPPTLLQVVHAVKQPVHPPTGTLTAERPLGGTTATLAPSHPTLNLDVPSTGQIALSASWTEVVDTDDPPRDVKDVAVQMSRIDPGAVALPPLIHEFGDTRHRMVTYTCKATTRFRDYFEAEPDESFQAEPLVQLVDVPSSAQPPAPVVSGVYPAFKWSGTELPPGWQSVVRARRGGRLRIELARPWHLSGDDERLAVVLPADPSTPRRLITTIRRDPIWPTPSPPIDPVPEHFPGGDSITLPAPGNGPSVTVVPFATHFAAPERLGDTQSAPGHWFVDVEMPEIANGSYCPFVHFAVARYQPHSLDDLHLSEIVRAEPAQLMPDRTLSVERTNASVTVILEGLTASIDGEPEGDGARPALVRAHLERWTGEGAPTELTAARPDLPGGWQRVSSVSGPVNAALPALEFAPGGGPFRLVVREVERFMGQVDPGSPADDVIERAVFLDVIDLS